MFQHKLLIKMNKSYATRPYSEMKYRHMLTSADTAMSEEPEKLTPYAIPAAAHQLPRNPAVLLLAW